MRETKYRELTATILLTIGTLSVNASCIDLQRAYPSVIQKCQGNRIYWRDGTSTLYDDGRHKSFEEALNHPDPEDMFRYPYPRGSSGYNRTPAKNFDPGRIRYEPLFRKMYGQSSRQVRRHLTTVDWFGYKVRVTTVNGVASHLRAVARDLARNPSLRKYLTPPGGGFYWRYIAGTKRLSVHSFGAAIDINVKYSAYWRWNKGAYRYRNQIPLEIVKAFERHGFIWGGKWYHYDTMHFEYRPELLHMRSPKSMLASPSSTKKQPHTSSHRSSPLTTKELHRSSKRTHKVETGDTLYGISRRYGTTVDKLKNSNTLKDNNIRPGQILTVPH
jgi:hypothetical protein